MNFRISGQRIQPKSSAKYLGLVINEFLNWKTHFTILRTKLEKSIGLLAKLKYFVSANFLRTVYFAIFDSYLCHGCQVQGQNKKASSNKTSRLQDKALIEISFKDQNTAVGTLYNEKKIISFFNLVTFYNLTFIAKHLNQNLPSSFGGYFTYMDNHHINNTMGDVKKLVNVFLCKTSFYGTQSITAKSVKDQNSFQSQVVFELSQEQVDTQN